MARQLSVVPDIDPPDSDYPAGRIRNENPPTTDGTPVIEELYGDIIQFFHKLMRLAGVSYNDVAENETAGFQFVEALATYIRTLSATTSQKGTSELATSAETQAGIDATRVVTPAGLESKTATESRKGILETATLAEVISGYDDERAVTPNKLRQVLRYGIYNLSSSESYAVQASIGLVYAGSGIGYSNITLPSHVLGLKQEIIVITKVTTSDIIVNSTVNVSANEIARFISNGTEWKYYIQSINSL